MGTPVVATKPIQPELCPPQKASNLLFVGGSGAFGVRTNCWSSFPPSTGQKWKFFQFFYVQTIYNDEVSYVKHVLDLLCVFFTLFAFFLGGGGLQRGLRHNLLMQFSSLGTSAAQK